MPSPFARCRARSACTDRRARKYAIESRPAAVQHIVAVHAHQPISPGSSRDRVVPGPGDQAILPRASVDRVAVGSASIESRSRPPDRSRRRRHRDPVVPSASDDHVVAAEAEDRVAAGGSAEDVGARRPDDEPVRAKQSGAADAGALTVAIASAATAVTTPLRRPRPVSSRCMHPSGRPRRFDAPPPVSRGQDADWTTVSGCAARGLRSSRTATSPISCGARATRRRRIADARSGRPRAPRASGARRPPIWSKRGGPHGAPSRRSLGGRTDPGVARRAARAPEPDATRLGFLTLAEVRAVLDGDPAWEATRTPTSRSIRPTATARSAPRDGGDRSRARPAPSSPSPITRGA